MTRVDLAKKFPSVYKWLLKNNKELLDEIFPLIHFNNKYTKEMCLHEAQKYQMKSKWARYSGGSFKAAKRNGWLVECGGHFINGRKYSRGNKTIKRSDGKIYKSGMDARRDGYKGLVRAIKTGGKCGGYRWAYCDDEGNVVE